MQTPIYNFEESKPVTAGSMTPFNVNCYGIIRDLMLEFTNSGAAATLANCKSSIERIVVLLNGMNVLDVSLSQIVDLFTFLGTRVQQTALVNVFSLNMGRLLYKAGITRDEFAWRCGKLGNADPTKKISSLVVQVYAGSTVTDITDVQLYSSRLNIEADWNDSYIQFNNNVQSFSDLFLLAIAYNGGGTITQGETLINNTNVTRAISQSVMDSINNLNGFGVISGAYVHNFCDGSTNSGLFVNDVTSELSVRTTFSKAPTTGYDLPVVKIHNCPTVIKNIVNSNDLIVVDNIPKAA